MESARAASGHLLSYSRVVLHVNPPLNPTQSQPAARKLYRARASASYADFMSSLHLDDAAAGGSGVDAIFSETSSLLGGGSGAVGGPGGLAARLAAGGRGDRDSSASSSTSSSSEQQEVDEAYLRRLEKLKAEEAAAADARARREEADRKALADAQRRDVEEELARDAVRLAALQAAQATEAAELSARHAAEKVNSRRVQGGGGTVHAVRALLRRVISLPFLHHVFPPLSRDDHDDLRSTS
jgi:hypothetical protein